MHAHREVSQVRSHRNTWLSSAGSPNSTNARGKPISTSGTRASVCLVLGREHRKIARPPHGGGGRGGVFPSASDDEVGVFSMFAPPICRRRWRKNAFPFRHLRRRRRLRSERSEQ